MGGHRRYYVDIGKNYLFYSLSMIVWCAFFSVWDELVGL